MSLRYNSDYSGSTTKVWLIALLCVMAVLLVWMGPSACTRPEQATRILSQSGYSEIQITGWRPMMAGQDDSVSTGFRAKAPNGQPVTGAVTGGLFKGSTIRLD